MAKRILHLGMFFCLLGQVYGQDVPQNSPRAKRALEPSFERLRSFRKELHQWDRAVRGFRQSHNFFGYLGQVSGRWRINGNIHDAKNAITNHYEDGFKTKANYWAFQYTYHLPISGSFGYYLGSSFGLVYDEASDDKELEIDRMLVFPGIATGVVYNLMAAIRLFAGIDAQLVRYERFRERHTSADVRETLTYFNAHSFTYLVGFDLFFRLRWAIRFQGEKSIVKNVKVGGSQEAELGISREKNSEKYLVGLLYHII